jgi:hypothetical protein
MTYNFADNNFKLYTPPEQVVLAVSRQHQIEAIFSTGGMQFEACGEFISPTGQVDGIELGARTARDQPLVRLLPGESGQTGLVFFDLDGYDGAHLPG